MRRPGPALAVSLLALAAFAAAIVAARIYYDMSRPETTMKRRDVVDDGPRGTYIRNRSSADARAAFGDERCEDGFRVDPGGYLAVDVRPGLPFTLCAPGAMAFIQDRQTGRMGGMVAVSADRIQGLVSEETVITLIDPKPKE